MCSCPHCHVSVTRDTIVCVDCGASLSTPRPVQSLPALPGVKVRLVAPQVRSVTVPYGHSDWEAAPQAPPSVMQPYVVRQDLLPEVPPVELWRDVAVPLIAFVFVITVVMGVAATLDVVGVTARGLAILAVPLAGAIWAESVWLEGRWRAGILNMLVWDAVLWTLAFGSIVI